MESDKKNMIFKRLNDEKDIVTKDDFYALSTDLLKIKEQTRNDIIEISTMLNRKKNDCFYIPYSIVKEYNDYQINWDEDPDLSLDEKGKNTQLLLSKELIKTSLKNQKFIDWVYKMVRYGETLGYSGRTIRADYLFSQNKMKRLLEDAIKSPQYSLEKIVQQQKSAGK